jgi:hypothetical protein
MNKVRFSFFSFPLIKIKKRDKPINKYRVVQTGAKSQFGGVNLGFTSCEYHIEMDEDVNSAPIAPTA